MAGFSISKILQHISAFTCLLAQHLRDTQAILRSLCGSEMPLQDKNARTACMKCFLFFPGMECVPKILQKETRLRDCCNGMLDSLHDEARAHQRGKVMRRDAPSP
jgi:hypothetical protein